MSNELPASRYQGITRIGHDQILPSLDCEHNKYIRVVIHAHEETLACGVVVVAVQCWMILFYTILVLYSMLIFLVILG